MLKIIEKRLEYIGSQLRLYYCNFVRKKFETEPFPEMFHPLEAIRWSTCCQFSSSVRRRSFQLEKFSLPVVFLSRVTTLEGSVEDNLKLFHKHSQSAYILDALFHASNPPCWSTRVEDRSSHSPSCAMFQNTEHSFKYLVFIDRYSKTKLWHFVWGSCRIMHPREA
jgi:hypothetical protein